MIKKILLFCFALCYQLSFASTIINESDTKVYYRYLDNNHHIQSATLPPHQSIDLSITDRTPINLVWIDIHNGQTYYQLYYQSAFRTHDTIKLLANKTIDFNGTHIG